MLHPLPSLRFALQQLRLLDVLLHKGAGCCCGGGLGVAQTPQQLLQGRGRVGCVSKLYGRSRSVHR